MWFSFIIYCVLTALLPGPNNILALSSVQSRGYFNTRYLLIGIYTGFTFMMLLSALLSKLATSSFDFLLDVLKYIGVVYLLYLAWSVLKGSSLEIVSEKVVHHSKFKDFLKGFLLQLVNVKIIVYGITAYSSFVLPHDYSNSVFISFAFLLSFIGCLATWIWAFSGHKLAFYLNKYALIVNRVMAVLLVYCALSLLY